MMVLKALVNWLSIDMELLSSNFPSLEGLTLLKRIEEDISIIKNDHQVSENSECILIENSSLGSCQVKRSISELSKIDIY